VLASLSGLEGWQSSASIRNGGALLAVVSSRHLTDTPVYAAAVALG
jgi:hypothetical protein